MTLILLALITLLIIAFVWSLILAALRKKALLQVSEKAKTITESLQKFIDASPAWVNVDQYAKFLRESNPEQMWARVVARYNPRGNQRVFRKLSHKARLIMYCLERMLERDNNLSHVLSLGLGNAQENLEFAIEMQKQQDVDFITLNQLAVDLKREFE